MFKIFCVLILTFAISQVTFANAKYQLERVNNNALPNVINSESIQYSDTQSQIKQKKSEQQSKTEQEHKKSSAKKLLTNYEYDEENYHYYKFEKYIKDNIDYARSGKMKY